MDPQTYGEPYCTACGYVLTGAVKSSNCPECGKPLVEVMGRKGAMILRGKRYRSKLTLFGLPVVDIAMGPGEGKLRGHAKGIIAIGDIATGVIAMGGIARGVVAAGGVAIGVMSFGGVGAGVLVGAGGCALGVGMSAGGLAASAGLSTGGLAIGSLAQGGSAIGWYARGGAAHSYGPGGTASPEAVAAFDRYEWFFGGFPPTAMSQFNTVAAVAIPPIVTVGLVGMLIVVAARRRDEQPNDLS